MTTQMNDLPVVPAIRNFATPTPTPRPAPVPAPQSTVQGILSGSAIAGVATTEASGGLVSWRGDKQLKLADLYTVVADLDSRFMPQPLSRVAQMSKVLDSLGTSYTIKPTAAPKVQRGNRTDYMTVSERGWLGQWSVIRLQTSNATAVGDKVGEVLAVVTLDLNGTATFTTDSGLTRKIFEGYMERTMLQTLNAGDVTAWLGKALRAVGAVKLGTTWYVPAAQMAGVSTLVDRLSKIWGEDWLAPVLPVATTRQLKIGLVKALVAEWSPIAEQLRDDASISARKATGILRQVDEFRLRLAHYTALLGSEFTSGLEVQVTAALKSLDGVLDMTAQRGAMLEM